MVLSGIPGVLENYIKRMRKQWIPGPFLRFLIFQMGLGMRLGFILTACLH